jgi:hypothetical protein
MAKRRYDHNVKLASHAFLKELQVAVKAQGVIIYIDQ